MLTRVKGKLEAFSTSCPDYIDLCDRASQFLIQREYSSKSNYDVTVKEEIKELINQPEPLKNIEKKLKGKFKKEVANAENVGIFVENSILALFLGNFGGKVKFGPSKKVRFAVRINSRTK